MLIEFVGLPGAGKTTVQQDLLESELELVKVVPQRKKFPKPIYETIYRHLLAILFFLMHPIDGIKIYFLIKKTEQASSNSFRAVYINLLYKLSFYSKLKYNKNYVMDEGFVHAILSIIIGSNNLVFDFSKFLRFAPAIEKWQLVYLKLDPKVAYERVYVRNRGTHRLHTLDRNTMLNQIVLVLEEFVESLNAQNLANSNVIDVDGQSREDVRLKIMTLFKM